MITTHSITVNTGSLLSHLQCPECGEHYSADIVQTVCNNGSCRSSLFAVYNLKDCRLSKDELTRRPASMWRYRELLPVLDQEHIITLGEGFTPILPLTGLRSQAGNVEVLWKDEAGNPTGSFKARGIGMAVSKAKELGIDTIVTPTAGNAGGALAAYAARAGMRAIVYMPVLTPQLFKDECRLYGAEVIEVDGNISDCGRLANEDALANGWFQVSTLKEPYRLEGKKTMGYEIVEQLNWQLPDVIFYPTGGGTGLIGLWKAFNEMEALGWIGSKRPQLVAVQSASCNGIVEAFHQCKQESVFTDGGFTIANGLRVPKPYADKLILRALYETRGNAVTVSDAEMANALKEIARHEGMLIAPEGAALWHAFKELKASGWIKNGQKVLLLNTGSGYKYLENLA